MIDENDWSIEYQSRWSVSFHRSSFFFFLAKILKLFLYNRPRSALIICNDVYVSEHSACGGVQLRIILWSSTCRIVRPLPGNILLICIKTIVLFVFGCERIKIMYIEKTHYPRTLYTHVCNFFIDIKFEINICFILVNISFLSLGWANYRGI